MRNMYIKQSYKPPNFGNFLMIRQKNDSENLQVKHWNTRTAEVSQQSHDPLRDSV